MAESPTMASRLIKAQISGMMNNRLSGRDPGMVDWSDVSLI